MCLAYIVTYTHHLQVAALVYFSVQYCIQYSSIVAVQSLSRFQDFVTPRFAACQASLSITISHSLLKLISIEWMMLYNYFILCCPLLLLPSIFPNMRVFSSESALPIRWPKYWSFSFSISPSNGYSGLISFRIDWLNLLAVQGTLKSLLQHHSWKAYILQHSAFLWPNSHIHIWLLEKNIVLTLWTFDSKVMPLLFNTLSRFVIAFFLRSKEGTDCSRKARNPMETREGYQFLEILSKRRNKGGCMSRQ